VSGSPVEPAPLFYINIIDLYDIIKLSVMMSGVVLLLASRLALRTSFNEFPGLSTRKFCKCNDKRISLNEVRAFLFME